MNNTTVGNASSLLLDENFLNADAVTIPNLVSPIMRLPINIYILQLILSKQWITSEFYAFSEAILELIICFFDILGVAAYFLPNLYLERAQRFFLGFIVTGRPFLLAVICVERYLAVVKPVVFLRYKPLKYKLALSGIILLWTLVSCSGSSVAMTRLFYMSVVGQIIACCVVKLYCCITTLRVLKRPGPGEGVRQKEGMNKIKLKAFRMILIITISVIVMHVPLVIVILLKDFMVKQRFLQIVSGCYLSTALAGFVHAVLFLKRCGKLPFLKWP